jgi:putative heme iron utilization protein
MTSSTTARQDAAANPFGLDVVAAITRHMNDDHPDDNLLIVRALGGRDTAASARMTGLDGLGADFAAVVDGAETPVRVPWSRELTERREVRVEVVRMYHEACAVLGIAPRQEGEH